MNSEESRNEGEIPYIVDIPDRSIKNYENIKTKCCGCSISLTYLIIGIITNIITNHYSNNACQQDIYLISFHMDVALQVYSFYLIITSYIWILILALNLFMPQELHTLNNIIKKYTVVSGRTCVNVFIICVIWLFDFCWFIVMALVLFKGTMDCIGSDGASLFNMGLFIFMANCLKYCGLYIYAYCVDMDE